MIGSTIEIDGKLLPYRPVAIMAYHMAQQELGFQALRTMLFITMLLGSVGAVGGQFSDFTWNEYKNWKKFADISVKEGPYNIYLGGSAFFVQVDDEIGERTEIFIIPIFNDQCC